MADGQGYSAGNLNFVIQAVGKESNNSLAKMNKNFKASAFSLTKLVNRIYFLRNYTKQLFRDLTGIIQKAVDYTETLNLWQVAMRGNREEAEDFVQTMNKAYGIATQTLMQYQAIFRNMLSSLGGVSDNVSYQLSEYLTQMAIDYASLYNVSIERAMTTFQSVLSGQVRPIRSIAGYDITETTIYQLYQQLGGTKTMRQLSQTEKRLLRIYAVFQQMESSGAIGDLGKTMESTANQWRMFTESVKELGTWLGIVFEPIIRDILPKINAFVITLTNIVKAFAQMRGIKPQEFGVIESVEQLNEELDKTQGKLLSFDKFESLNSSSGDGNLLGIDESLLAGISQYTSILDGITGKAQELAKQWTAIFIDPETGKWTKTAEDLFDAIKSIGISLTIIAGLSIIDKIRKASTAIGILTTSTKILNGVLLTGAIYAIIKAIDAFKEGDTWAGIFAMAVGFTLAGAFITLQIVMSKQHGLGKLIISLFARAISATGSFAGAIFTLSAGFLALGASIAGAFLLIQNWGDMNTWQKVVGVIGVLTTAILGLAMAMGVFHSAWSIGLATAGIVAGIGMMVASISSVKKEVANPVQYKTGGLVEDGLFQMSRGEIVGEFDDGTTRVANNQQITAGIENASYRGITRGLREINFGGGNVYIDKKKVGQIIAKPSHKEMVRTGLVKVSS